MPSAPLFHCRIAPRSAIRCVTRRLPVIHSRKRAVLEFGPGESRICSGGFAAVPRLAGDSESRDVGNEVTERGVAFDD